MKECPYRIACPYACLGDDPEMEMPWTPKEGFIRESNTEVLCLDWDVLVTHAPLSICGNCGAELYSGLKPISCPVCGMKWELTEWYKSPEKGSERWLKYHASCIE